MIKNTLTAVAIVAGLTLSSAAFADQYNGKDFSDLRKNEAQYSNRAEPNPANANGTFDHHRYSSRADERAKNNRSGCGMGTWRFCPNNEFHYNSGDTSTDTHVSTR
jgi:hypothetical protein